MVLDWSMRTESLSGDGKWCLVVARGDGGGPGKAVAEDMVR